MDLPPYRYAQHDRWQFLRSSRMRSIQSRLQFLDYLLDSYDNVAIVYRNYVLEALDGSLAKGPYIKTIVEDAKYINNKTWTDIPN